MMYHSPEDLRGRSCTCSTLVDPAIQRTCRVVVREIEQTAMARAAALSGLSMSVPLGVSTTLEPG